MTERVTHICGRTDDPTWTQVEGSIILNCEACNRDVYVSPASMRSVAGLQVTYLCIQCARDQAVRTGEKFIALPMTSGQRAEFEAAIAATRPKKQ